MKELFELPELDFVNFGAQLLSGENETSWEDEL